MRTLMLMLILANLGVFAWYYWVAADSDTMSATRLSADTGKPLFLVGEDATLPDALPAPTEDDGAVLAENSGKDTAPPADDAGVDPGVEDAQSNDSAEENSPAGADGSPVAEERADALACATLGPFDDEELAQTVVGRLLERGYVPELRSTGGQIRSGFWVYLPPFDDRDTAKATEGRLRDRGVKDLFIVTGDENRNAISLGLFSTAERADQRAAEIGRLGFSPRVAERFRDATVYWVDFREKPGQELQPENIGVLDAADLLPEKQPIPCNNQGRNSGSNNE